MFTVTVVLSAILKLCLFLFAVYGIRLLGPGGFFFFAAVPRATTKKICRTAILPVLIILSSCPPLSAPWLHQLAASTSYCRCPRLLRFPSVRPRRSSLSPLITPSVLPLWMQLLAVLDVMCAADRRRLCLCHGGSFLNQVRRLLKDLNYRGKPHQTCNHTHLCSHGLHTNHAASHVMSGFFFCDAYLFVPETRSPGANTFGYKTNLLRDSWRQDFIFPYLHNSAPLQAF